MKQLSKKEMRRLNAKHSKEELKRSNDSVYLRMTDNHIYYEIGSNNGSSLGEEAYCYYYFWDEYQKYGIRKILDHDIFDLIHKFFELGINTEKARISQILGLG
jgi:hypothetical protein